jgi:hypothetical protein
MHKMDWRTIRHELPEETNRTEMITALEELIRQLDERFVKREDFEEHSRWLLSQQAAAWDRMIEHTHREHGEVVFPDDDEKEECDE